MEPSCWLAAAPSMSACMMWRRRSCCAASRYSSPLLSMHQKCHSVSGLLDLCSFASTSQLCFVCTRSVTICQACLTCLELSSPLLCFSKSVIVSQGSLTCLGLQVRFSSALFASEVSQSVRLLDLSNLQVSCKAAAEIKCRSSLTN